MKKKRHSAKRIIGGILFTAAFIVFAVQMKLKQTMLFPMKQEPLLKSRPQHQLRPLSLKARLLLPRSRRPNPLRNPPLNRPGRLPSMQPPSAFPNRRISTSTTGSMCLSTVIIPWTRLTTLRPISCISTWLATTPKSAPDMTETGRLSTQ